jgi:hypothetical protein
VLFEKLIEQHRIDRFIANGIDLPIFIANDQVRVHFLDLLSD